MCTVLKITDVQGNIYKGRTNEYCLQQPDELSFWPAGTRIESVTPNGKPGKAFNTQYAIFGATLMGMTPGTKQDTIHDGVNDQGMSITANYYPGNGEATITAPDEQVLSIVDFAAWALGSFKTAAEVKQALLNNEVAIWLPRLALMANKIAPVHYAVYDPQGGAIVVEFTGGKVCVYNNDVGVMTNEPNYPWHVENMNNYANMTNVDVNSATFNGLTVTASGTGNALATVPSTETSPGRFVKAAYYSHFAKKASTPEQAIMTLGHVMNNFDRPWNISIDLPGTSDLVVTHSNVPDSDATFYTVLHDLTQNLFFIRTINSLNFTRFDVKKLGVLKAAKTVSFDALNAHTNLDGTDLFLK